MSGVMSLIYALCFRHSFKHLRNIANFVIDSCRNGDFWKLIGNLWKPILPFFPYLCCYLSNIKLFYGKTAIKLILSFGRSSCRSFPCFLFKQAKACGAETFEYRLHYDRRSHGSNDELLRHTLHGNTEPRPHCCRRCTFYSEFCSEFFKRSQPRLHDNGQT